MSRGGASQLAVPLVVAAAVTAGVVGLGGSPSARPSVAPQVAPSPLTLDQQRGRDLYMRDCAWCHGEAGEGSIYGTPIEGSGAASVDFMLRTGRMPIEEPRSNPPAAPPAYSPVEIGQVVAFTSTFVDGPDVPAVDPARGDLGEGAILYQQHCAACHSSTGIGAALTSGETAPEVRTSSAVEIGEAMLVGGAGLVSGDMPRFADLPPEDVDSIARYILDVLATQQDPGGLSLYHVGPVVEGFVAVFVLLPLLALVIRWLGKKTT